MSKYHRAAPVGHLQTDIRAAKPLGDAISKRIARDLKVTDDSMGQWVRVVDLGQSLQRAVMSNGKVLSIDRVCADHVPGASDRFYKRPRGDQVVGQKRIKKWQGKIWLPAIEKVDAAVTDDRWKARLSGKQRNVVGRRNMRTLAHPFRTANDGASTAASRQPHIRRPNVTPYGRTGSDSTPGWPDAVRNPTRDFPISLLRNRSPREFFHAGKVVPGGRILSSRQVLQERGVADRASNSSCRWRTCAARLLHHFHPKYDTRIAWANVNCRMTRSVLENRLQRIYSGRSRKHVTATEKMTADSATVSPIDDQREHPIPALRNLAIVAAQFASCGLVFYTTSLASQWWQLAGLSIAFCDPGESDLFGHSRSRARTPESQCEAQ